MGRILLKNALGYVFIFLQYVHNLNKPGTVNNYCNELKCQCFRFSSKICLFYYSKGFVYLFGFCFVSRETWLLLKPFLFHSHFTLFGLFCVINFVDLLIYILQVLFLLCLKMFYLYIFILACVSSVYICFLVCWLVWKSKEKVYVFDSSNGRLSTIRQKLCQSSNRPIVARPSYSFAHESQIAQLVFQIR